MSVVLGIFSDSENAQQAILNLEERDYNPKDISILMKDRAQAQQVAEDTGAKDVAGSTLEGAGTGAILGGLAGFLAGTVLPGLGGFLIGGPIGAALGLSGAAATTVSGAATGAVAGGLIGALMSAFGLTEDEAREYQTEINNGGILVAVPARSGEESEVRTLLEEAGADNIRSVRSEDSNRSRSTSHHRESDYTVHMGAKGGQSRSSRK